MTGTWSMRGRGLAAAAVGLAATLATVCLAGAPGPAAAGGGEWMYPVRDRYEPGQDVLMVGYTQSARASGTDPAGPYYAWLRVDPAAEARAAGADGTYVDPTDVRVAQLVVEAANVDDARGWRRATISFTLPSGLGPGHYVPVLCNDPCTQAPGYLVPDTLNVGVAPEYRMVRDWPASEPAHRWLDDDALVYGPSGEVVTAADRRAGRIPAPTTSPSPSVPAAAAEVEVEVPMPPEADAARPRVAGDARSTSASPGGAGGRAPSAGSDGAGAPTGGWVAGFVAAAIAAAALVARRRAGRHVVHGHGPEAPPAEPADAPPPPAPATRAAFGAGPARPTTPAGPPASHAGVGRPAASTGAVASGVGLGGPTTPAGTPASGVGVGGPVVSEGAERGPVGGEPASGGARPVRGGAGPGDPGDPGGGGGGGVGASALVRT